ncbi:hypothetical protein ACFLT9_02930 [Acidobacteriota bacterium]
MDNLTVLKELGRVEAPEYFEQNVLAELSMRKKRRIRARQLRLSFTGSASVLAIVLVVLSLFVIPQDTLIDLSNLEKGFSESLESGSSLRGKSFVPITETVDYSREIRSLRPEPPTVYILEQVSNRTDANIKY